MVGGSPPPFIKGVIIIGNPILTMENIFKNFGNIQALKDVDFCCYKGQVHGLAGENGAGKSTLSKIITGVHQPDSGTIKLKGEKINFKNPKEGQKNGIAMVYQELSVLPELTVGENIFLDREPKTKLGLIDNEKINIKTKKLLKEYEIKLSPKKLVKDLSIAQQQMVEILKIMVSEPEVIIFDEPTSALAKEEVQKLYKIINKLKKENKAVIFISHRIEELLNICDKVTILKDGEYIDTVKTKEADQNEIINLMIGRSLQAIYPEKNSKITEKKIFEVKNLNVEGKISNINFDAKKGDIIGIAGLEGNGQTELLRSLAGLLRNDSGKIYIKDEKANIHNSTSAIKSGITLIPADRKTAGLLLTRSVRENIALTSLYLRKKYNFIKLKKELEFVSNTIDKLNIKTPNMQQLAGYLSGGNQQKVVLGKSLGIKPRVLLFNRPTRGIDVEAKQEFYKRMRELANDGVAVIMSSADLMEIIGMSDKVLVMYEGKISGKLIGENITEENIMHYAVGQS